MKIAFCLKGAVATVDGKLDTFDRNSSVHKRFVDWKRSFNDVQKHIVQANPKHEFDFYIHCWHPELQNEMVRTISPVEYLFEDNIKYKNEIEQIIQKTTKNNKHYGQVSMCLSYKKVVEMIENKQYDRVIFYRHDLMLNKDMNLSEYDEDKIYVNRCDKNRYRGDFHIVCNYKNALLFGKMYDTLGSSLEPRDHKIINTFVRMHNLPLEMDSIKVGTDQEVLRKVKC